MDTEHHLIVTHEVTNTGSDRSQLAKVASQYVPVATRATKMTLPLAKFVPGCLSSFAISATPRMLKLRFFRKFSLLNKTVRESAQVSLRSRYQQNFFNPGLSEIYKLHVLETKGGPVTGLLLVQAFASRTFPSPFMRRLKPNGGSGACRSSLEWSDPK